MGSSQKRFFTGSARRRRLRARPSHGRARARGVESRRDSSRRARAQREHPPRADAYPRLRVGAQGRTSRPGRARRAKPRFRRPRPRLDAQRRRTGRRELGDEPAKRASADASAEAKSLSSTSLTKVTSAARRANGGADASRAQRSNARRCVRRTPGVFARTDRALCLHIQSPCAPVFDARVVRRPEHERRVAKGGETITIGNVDGDGRLRLCLRRRRRLRLRLRLVAPRDVPPSDASVKSDDRSSSGNRFENTSFVVPATSRRSRTSASSPSRREGARGGKRWSAAEGSGSTSSCVRAGGAAGRGERGAGKAGRVARRARGKGAGQHDEPTGTEGRRRRARTSNMIIPASLSSQYSERMSSKAAWYFATPHLEEEATAAGSPLSPSRVWHACITASRHDSLSFPPPSPAVPDGLLEPHARGLLRGPHQHALHLLAQASAGLARRDRHARPRPEN